MIINKYQKERIKMLISEQDRDNLMPILSIQKVTDTIFELTYDNDRQTKELIKVDRLGKLSPVYGIPIYSKYYNLGILQDPPISQ